MGESRVVAHLDDGVVSVLLVSDGGAPEIAHWGASLGSDPSSWLLERPVPGGNLDEDVPLGVIVEAGRGWFGRPGIEGHRADGSDFAPRFAIAGCERDELAATVQLRDDIAGLAIELRLRLEPSGVLVVGSTLTNSGETPFELDALRLTLPVPGRAREVLTVGGRHAHEFLVERTPWERTCLSVENRHGKTSHERLGAVVAVTPHCGEQSGEAWGVHIGWSGNFEIVCDGVTDGRRCVQSGELLLPGEVVLAPGEAYRAPDVFAAWSDAGLSGMSQRFHRYLRDRPSHPRLPRPVVLNTWEAVYFDHDLGRLRALAERAASCGIERFVLDDGWFHLRRDDRAGLGDWWPDPVVWPDGVRPIADHVRALGMEFGIWVEPEMVNPESELAREHPDWVLADIRYPPVLGRNQLVLDIGRDGVRDHIFARLDTLLRSAPVSFVKWDHNRDLVAPASGRRAGVRRQTLGAYELLDRLRAAHPGVEFETCASGGGRADFGILARTDRVWTSDSIDALDRHRIQRGFSLLFPPELMGSHVGAERCHTTDRRHGFGFRAAAALFGSFGVEWDLLSLGSEDLDALAAAIATYKTLRGLLHTGDVVRIDHPDPNVEVHAVVGVDRRAAVVGVTRLASGASHHTDAIRLPGLDPERQYSVRRLDLAELRLGHARAQPRWVESGLDATGRHLATIGLLAPVLLPETTLLLHITATN